MAIETDATGFTRATLETENEAQLYARFEPNDLDTDPLCFRVRTEAGQDDERGWCFNEAGCREASEFFTKLADELARRSRGA